MSRSDSARKEPGKPSPQLLFTPAEAAAQLGITEAQLEHKRRIGRAPDHLRLTPSITRYFVSAVKNYNPIHEEANMSRYQFESENYRWAVGYDAAQVTLYAFYDHPDFEEPIVVAGNDWAEVTSVAELQNWLPKEAELPPAIRASLEQDLPADIPATLQYKRANHDEIIRSIHIAIADRGFSSSSAKAHTDVALSRYVNPETRPGYDAGLG